MMTLTTLFDIQYRIGILYALDVYFRMRQRHQESSVLEHVGVVLLFCLILLPTKMVDRCYRHVICFVVMLLDFHWIKKMSENRIDWFRKQLPPECPKTIGYLAPLMNNHLSTYCQMFQEKFLNVNVYVVIICTLFCMFLVSLMFKLLKEQFLKPLTESFMSLALQIVLHWLAFKFSFLKITDNNVQTVFLLVLQGYLAWFYTRVFSIHGYMQVLVTSVFIYTEIPRISFMVLIIFTFWYLVVFLAKLEEHTSNFCNYTESLDLRKVCEKHYRKILLSLFFYASFNLVLTGLSDYMHNFSFETTMGAFCATWVGTGCLIILIFYVTRGVLAFTVLYMRGFQSIRFRLENPGISDVWIMIVLAVQSSDSDLTVYGFYIKAGILMMTATLLNEVHNLSEPVLMEHIAYKHFSRKQIMIFVFFVFLAVFPCIMIAFVLQMSKMSAWWSNSVIMNLATTTVESIASIFLHFIIRFSFFGSDFGKYENLAGYTILLCLVVHVLYFISFVLWCISSFTLTVSGVVMPLLSVVYLYTRWNYQWQLLNERNYKIARLLWRPGKYDRQLVPYENKCSICLCGVCMNSLGYILINRCNHFFHESCFRKWCQYKDECPLCQ